MILITGATGLLGSHLVKELAQTNSNIVALYHTTKPTKDIEHLAIWKQVDVLDVVALENVMQGITQVYHCAAIVSFEPAQKKAMHQLNVEGTTNIVNACINAKVNKLLHVSSVAALERYTNNKLVTEKDFWSKTSINSEYGKSKYYSELEVWRGFAEGLPIVVVNPSVIVGAGNWNNGSTAMFKKAYEQFAWYSNGSNGFVSVKDCVAAMIALMNSNIVGERFIINSWNKSFKDLFTAMANGFHKKPPYKKVTPFIANIAWRLESMKCFFTKQQPLITKETAASAQANVAFDNSKLLHYLPNFKYSNFQESINVICKELKEKYKLV